MHISRWLIMLALAAAGSLGITSHATAQVSYGPPYRISGGFENPFGVAIDATNGHLIVSDTRKRQLQWTTLSSLTGTPTFQAFGLVANANQADALIDPQGVAADGSGHVYVVDARRNVVKLYTWNATVANYVIDNGFTAGTASTVDGIAIQSPRDIAVAPDGKIYLLESGNHRVLRADSATASTWSTFINDATLSNPYGIDVGPDGRVYIADTDHDRVVRYNSAGGSPVAFGRRGTGGAELRAPRDVAADIDGRMYVVDSHNHRIEILDSNGHHLKSLGRAPALGGLQKIAVDSSRRIYLTDADFDVVVAFLGPSAPVPFDAWSRDYVGDTGAEPSDPAFTLASPDIVVRHAPDVDVAAAQTNGLESIAFQSPRYGEDNFLYVAVRNRGTQLLTDAVAKLYWADPSTALSFPADWHSDGFIRGTSGMVTDNSLLVPPIAPGESRVLGPLRWRPPAPEIASLGAGMFVLGLRLIQDFDVPENGTGLDGIRNSNNVVIRSLHVVRGPWPTGDQNTLVVLAGYSDDSAPIDSTAAQAHIAALGSWVSEVSWGVASIKPLYRGQINLPHPHAYYADASRTRLIEMTQDALSLVLGTEPDLLDGVLPGPEDDIGRIILITNDTTPDIDWATTGSWPYVAPNGSDRYLTASVQGIGNSNSAFEHGLGHQLGMLDLFAYPNVSFPRPFADGWDNMAQPFSGVHPTVWSKELATWVSEHGASIQFVPRPARGTSYTTITPIHLFNQATAASGQTVGVALGLTPGVGTITDETAFYYLESRSPTTGGADAAVPGDGVLLYYVNARIPQGQGPIIVRDHTPGTATIADAALPNGSSESPAGTGITVNVVAGTAGAAHDITLLYTPPPTGYDVWIATGDPASTSPDIWVDNQSDGYDVENGRTPTDNGDRAIGGEENRIYARVHNAGEADAFDVEVAFFISEPYHTIGGEADFTFLKSVVIPYLPPGDTTVYVTWTPTVQDPHTCVKVVLRRLLDDTNSANNSAQQNLEVVWSTTHSPFTPVTTTVQVTNPDQTANKLMYFRTDALPRGWKRQLVPDRAYLAPGQTILVHVTLTPPSDAPNCTSHDVQVTAWTPAKHTLVRVGGTTVNVNLATQTGLDMNVDVLTADAGNCKVAETKRYAECLDAAKNGWVPHLGRGGWAGLVGSARGPDRVAVSGDKLQWMRSSASYPPASSCRAPGETQSRVHGNPYAPLACGAEGRLILKTQGCTNPVQPNQKVVLRYRDANGNPEYRVVQTDANGCFEDFQVITSGGEWSVTADIEANNCLAPVEETRMISTPPVPTDSSRNEIRPSKVDPVSLKARGTLKLQKKGTAACARCRVVHTEHRFEIALSDASSGVSFGTLTSDALNSALDPLSSIKTAVGVHLGDALLKQPDGTVVTGVMRGTTNLSSQLRALSSGYSSGLTQTSLARGFVGEFVGRVIEGKRLGCRLILHYGLLLKGDPGTGNGQISGFVVGAWECPCEKNVAPDVPQRDPLPDGCVIPFVVNGRGKWRTDAQKEMICSGKSVSGTITSSDAATTGVAGISPVALTNGTFRIDTMNHVRSGNGTSPGLHRGRFHYVSATGDRIEGSLTSGVTNMTAYHPAAAPAVLARHVEGILKGQVTAGTFMGCELRGVYSASYVAGATSGSPADWTITGAIVCPCAQKEKGSGRGSEAPLAVPDEVRESIRKQIEEQQAAHIRARDEALIKKFGDPARLGAAERRLADRDGDGVVSAMEMASFITTRDLFRQRDRNGDGTITLEEFNASAVEDLTKLMRVAAARYSAGDKERASLPLRERALLAAADVNKDGRISEEELSAAATRSARAQFAALDRDHDGRVTLKEFARAGGAHSER